MSSNFENITGTSDKAQSRAIAKTQNTNITSTSHLTSLSSELSDRSSRIGNRIDKHAIRNFTSHRPNIVRSSNRLSGLNNSGPQRRNPFLWHPNSNKMSSPSFGLGGLRVLGVNGSKPASVLNRATPLFPLGLTPPSQLHPNGPAYENIQSTISRHLRLANSVHLNPTMLPHLTVQAIFKSLKRELQDSLVVLSLEICCSICNTNTGEWGWNWHVDSGMRDALEALQSDIKSIDTAGWMDVAKLKSIADDIGQVWEAWKTFWKKTSCNEGLLMGSPKAPTEEERLGEGVLFNLSPFERRSSHVPQDRSWMRTMPRRGG